MAGIIAAVLSDAVTFTKSTDESATKTILQVTAPTSQKVKILRYGVFFNEETGDATPAIPLLVKVGKSAAGSGTTATAYAVKPTSLSLRATALKALSSAATLTSTLDQAYVNAQTGYEVIFPMGQEIELDPAESLSINVTAGTILSTGNLSCIAKIWFEE